MGVAGTGAAVEVKGMEVEGMEVSALGEGAWVEDDALEEACVGEGDVFLVGACTQDGPSQ